MGIKDKLKKSYGENLPLCLDFSVFSNVTSAIIEYSIVGLTWPVSVGSRVLNTLIGTSVKPPVISFRDWSQKKLAEINEKVSGSISRGVRNFYQAIDGQKNDYEMDFFESAVKKEIIGYNNALNDGAISFSMNFVEKMGIYYALALIGNSLGFKFLTIPDKNSILEASLIQSGITFPAGIVDYYMIDTHKELSGKREIFRAPKMFQDKKIDIDKKSVGKRFIYGLLAIGIVYSFFPKGPIGDIYEKYFPKKEIQEKVIEKESRLENMVGEDFFSPNGIQSFYARIKK